MLKVIAIGECYKKVGHKEVKKVEFKEEFEVSKDFEPKMLMIVQRMLINGRLTKNVDNYMGVSTCSIDTIKELKKKAPVLSREEMNKLERQELIEYAAKHGLFFRGSKLGRIFEMRDRIAQEVGEPEMATVPKSASKREEFED